jgi:Ser/Thr protein kinase RdoA (MazF antagonist)
MDNITTEKMLYQALKLYDLKQPETEFIRHNENITYKITDIDKKYLLRIHKPIEGFSPNTLTDYSHSELISSEIEIISALKNGTDLSVQTPISGLDGNFVQTILNNIPVTLLEWVEGEDAQTA